MKRYSWFILILILILTFFSCSDIQSDSRTESQNDTVNQLTPTGRSDYPKDQVQCEMIVYDGIKWISYYRKTVDKLPEGYTVVGEIVMDDVYREPTEEFHASHVPEGSEIYAKTETAHYTDNDGNRKNDLVYALIDGKYVEFQYCESVIEALESLIFYDGILWIRCGEKRELPDGFSEVGRILENHIDDIPKEEFHSLRLSVASVIYADTKTQYNTEERKENDRIYAFCYGAYGEYKYLKEIGE